MKHSLKRRTFVTLAVALSVVLFITMLAVFAQDAAPTPWDGQIATSYAGGTGTEADPYQIETAGQLAFMAAQINAGIDVDKHYVLLADIALNDTAEYEKFATAAPKNAWESIGASLETPFKGTFDGQGHEISGLYFKKSNIYFSGLFGCLDGATVKDLTISKGYVESNYGVGALAGYANASNVSGIYNKNVHVQFRGAVTERQYAGGILGCANDYTVIHDCHTDAVVFAYNSGTSGGADAYVGGIVARTSGSDEGRITITACTAKGENKSVHYHHYRTNFAGGIAGQVSYTDISGCYVSASFQSHCFGRGYLGGIVGDASNSNIVSNVSAAAIDAVTSLRTDQENVHERLDTSCGGIVGYGSTNAYVANNVFYGTITLPFDKLAVKRTGSVVGYGYHKSTNVSYNYYIPASCTVEGVETAIPAIGTSSVTNMTQTNNFAITEDHLTGAATTVIAEEGKYSNTANLVAAMNAYVLDYNNFCMTVTQGDGRPVAYKTYYRNRAIAVNCANGVCTMRNAIPDVFPAGYPSAKGYIVGETIAFGVEANEGYVIRKVEYAYGGTTYDLQPNAQGNYEFVMPDADVTINLHFVETGADVYSITYLGCEEVSAWSAYQIKAHFKGYDTVIPTPTRPNHDFAGWLVNGSTTPMMSLTLGGNDYTSNITITATWTPKKLVQISFDAQSCVYDGSQKTFELLGAHKDMAGIVVKYLVNDEWTTEAPIASGVYSVRITRAEDATYQSIDTVTTFTIAKAPSSVIFENSISKVYNNAVVANPIITTVGDGEITYHFFNSAGQEIAAPKAVGSYTVTVRMAEGANYLAQEETLAFTISKATIDASAIAWSYSEPFVYSARAHSVYVEGVPSDVTVNYSGTRTAINAGTYTVSATFTYDEANYNPISIEPLEWTISKRMLTDIDLMWVYNEAFVYDMSMKEVTIDGLPEDVTVKEYIQNVAIDAGTYTASAVFEFDSTNYESVSISPLTWEIKKAKIDVSTIQWTTTSVPFNGQLQSITLTGVPAGVEVLYSGNEYVVAGTYFATAIFFADEANYEHIRSMTTAWTIEKAETVISADIVNKFLADGTAHIPAASINHTEAELQYSLPAQVNPGTYWYVISTVETNNYKAAQITVKLQLTQSDSGLISLAIEENNKARSATTLTAMYQSISQAYVYLSMVEDKEAKAFVDVYNEVMLTVSVYNKNVNKATDDMGSAFKQLFAPTYKIVPKPIVRELLDFILKNFD